MIEQDEKIKDNIIQLYENGDYDFIERSWGDFPSELRLELIYRAAKDGVRRFTEKAHFEAYKEDIELIKMAKKSLIEKFGLDAYQARSLSFGLKGARYETKDEWQNFLARTIAVYSKLREYNVIAEKYDCVSLDFFREYFNILKCDPRRTESRIQFLLEQGNGKVPQTCDFATDLAAHTSVFNLKYQKAIEQKLYLLEKGSVAYTAIAEQVNVLPDYAYDKFLELALRAVYQDKILLKIIDKKRREVWLKKQKIEQSVSEIPENPKKEDNEIPESNEPTLAYEEEIKELEDLFDGALVIPIDEGTREIGTVTTGAVVKPNNREALEDEKIESFLIELRKMGIECEGSISTSSGVPALNKEDVIFYVLKVGNYRILEPIGQVGNATYLTKDFESLEELREVLTSNTRSELVRKGFAIRINHERTEEQCYEYSTQRISNIVTLVNEFKDKKNLGLNLSQIRAEVTQIILQKEVPEVSKYIWELSQRVGTKIAGFILKEKDSNQETTSVDKPKDTSIEGDEI